METTHGTSSAEPAATSVAAVGMCPKCHAWFPCDDWFDNSLPLPSCPDCRLAPVKIEYRIPPADDLVEVDLTQSEAWLG